jgi:hypothetical protein
MPMAMHKAHALGSLASNAAASILPLYAGRSANTRDTRGRIGEDGLRRGQHDAATQLVDVINVGCDGLGRAGGSGGTGRGGVGVVGRVLEIFEHAAKLGHERRDSRREVRVASRGAAAAQLGEEVEAVGFCRVIALARASNGS